MPKRKEEAILVYSKGDSLLEGNVHRLRMIRTLCRVVCHYDKEAALLEDGVNMLLIIPKDHIGDPTSIQSKAINKIYLDSIYTEKESEDKVRKIVDLYDAAGGDPKDVGYGLLLRYTDKLMMKDISASIFYR